MDYETVPIAVTPTSNGFLVVCRGTIQGNSEMIQAELDRVIKAKPTLVQLDMTDLEYITSSGIGILVNLRNRVVQGGGTLKTIGVHPRTMNILKLSQLSSFLGIQTTGAE